MAGGGVEPRAICISWSGLMVRCTIDQTLHDDRSGCILSDFDSTFGGHVVSVAYSVQTIALPGRGNITCTEFEASDFAVVHYTSPRSPRNADFLLLPLSLFSFADSFGFSLMFCAPPASH